jgi:hypothetical protein
VLRCILFVLCVHRFVSPLLEVFLWLKDEEEVLTCCSGFLIRRENGNFSILMTRDTFCDFQFTQRELGSP